MGLRQSNLITESELSEDDDDIDVVQAQVKTNIVKTSEPDNRLDAIMKQQLPECVLPLENLQAVEEQLDKFEIVSLIYLLYEDSGFALHVLKEVVDTNNTRKGLLYKWAQLETITSNKWQKKLLEALCIIQNYQILKSLGYNKVDLQYEYLPFQVETSCAVKRIRKVLYLIAEKLTKDQSVELIYNMKRSLLDKNIRFCQYDSNFLELYFLHWETYNVNFKDIHVIFKSMDLDLFCDQLKSCLPVDSLNTSEIEPQLSKERNITRDNTYLQSQAFEDILVTAYQGSSKAMRRDTVVLSSDRYLIDANNPGIALIINQEKFYTEPDQNYRHLLHEFNNTLQLPDRDGTSKDKLRLKKLFTRMRFKVEVCENLAHFDMLTRIEKATDAVSDESSLIICILSHGNTGVVYGANSCRVEVHKIENIMCKKNKKLIGKPKVLILQSCQGQQCQKVEEETADDLDDNATDGPTRVPPTADLLTFWATIPGYAAIRNKTTGSWFIQALCDEIENGNSKYHILDICTRAANRVTNREWKDGFKTNIMTPMVVFTLTKAFYLPALGPDTS